jgi:hypothetical protein
MVLALGAKVGHLDPGDKHEHPDPRGLGPDPPLVVEAADDLAAPAAAALHVIPHDPERLIYDQFESEYNLYSYLLKRRTGSG